MPTRTSMLVLAATVAVFVAGATGCSAPSANSTSVSPAPVPTSTAPATSSSASASPTVAVTPPVSLAHLKIHLVRRWSGFRNPLYLTNAGDGSGRIFVAEQGGTVRVIRNGKVASRPYLDVSQLVSTGGERGLLGMAFAPDFARNGHVYVDYTDTNGNTVVARYIAKDPASDSPAWNAPQRLLHVTQPYANHNGGCLQFGPDGNLWVGMGDGGSGGDPGNRAQNPKVLLGKLLRINVEGRDAGSKYAIPSGQPVRTGWAPQVWMLGLRNPWRFSFDASSSMLWIADVGQDAWEEIDVVDPVKGGQNLGWPWWEGTHSYRPGSKRDSFVFPVHDYPHPTGESITGGYVYRGSKYPAMVGTYLYADYVKGWIGALRTTAPDGTPLSRIQSRTMLKTSGLPSSFGLDEARELYLIDWQDGVVYTVAGTAK
jgi:glucose/arabinose dehydrogenase